MTASYSLSENAKEDMYRIWLYGLEQYGLAAADRYSQGFFDHFDALAQNPYLCPAVDHIREGYRRCVCGADNVYYRLNGDVVEVMAIIRHQDPQSWL